MNWSATVAVAVYGRLRPLEAPKERAVLSAGIPGASLSVLVAKTVKGTPRRKNAGTST